MSVRVNVDWSSEYAHSCIDAGLATDEREREMELTDLFWMSLDTDEAIAVAGLVMHTNQQVSYEYNPARSSTTMRIRFSVPCITSLRG